jgi:uncharacterized SAM-binding protein YcdF (DUF218 family)
MRLRVLTRFLLYSAATAGALLAVVSLTPVTFWWATALAKPWGGSGGDVLIVLSGDVLDNGMLGQTSYWRSTYAILTWKEGNFRRLILSGESRITEPMRQFLVCQGISPGAIIMEDRSESTRENAIYTAELARQIPGRYVLLTSDYHMFRAWRAFRKAGLQTTGRPFPDARKRVNSIRARWTIFCDLIQETAAVAYYAFRGWI